MFHHCAQLCAFGFLAFALHPDWLPPFENQPSSFAAFSSAGIAVGELSIGLLIQIHVHQHSTVIEMYVCNSTDSLAFFNSQ